MPQHVPVVLEGFRKVGAEQLAVAPEALEGFRQIWDDVALRLVLEVELHLSCIFVDHILIISFINFSYLSEDYL